MTDLDASFVRASEDDLNALFGRLLLPTIRAQLEVAGRAQRLRVTSLPKTVADSVCRQLQGDTRWVARVIADGQAANDWEASATKLIELRNILAEPLLVFVPPGLRVAAEDSLDVATFSELSLTDLDEAARADLLSGLSNSVRDRVNDTLAYCQADRVIQNPDQVLRYLLTLHKNGGHGWAAGAALFELGLIPHFGLHAQPNQRLWLSRNKNAVAALADARAPLQERITKLRLEPGSIQRDLFAFYRARAGTHPTESAAAIACEPTYRRLTLDSWRFADSGEDHNLRLVVESIDLPMQIEDSVGGALPMPVLNLNDKKKGLKVVFRSIPAPAQVDSWATFRVHLLSPGDPPASVWESNSYAKPAGRLPTIRRTIKVDDLDGVDEGTYFLRVQAYDKAGAILDQSRPLTAVDPGGRKENESELFLVTRGEAEIEPTAPRTIRVNSLLEAWALSAARILGSKQAEDLPDRKGISGAWIESAGAAPRGVTHFRLGGTVVQGYEVVLAAVLRKAEYEILRFPEHIGAYRINAGRGKDTADIQLERRPTPVPPESEALGAFLALRKAVFTAILGQPKARSVVPTEDAYTAGTVETADLVEIAILIEEYATAFSNLVTATISSDGAPSDRPTGMTALATMDTIELRWRGNENHPGRAVLLAPTHPTRLLWHARHATEVDRIVANWSAGKPASNWGRFVERFLALRPINTPPVLFDERGRGYVECGPLAAAWSLYAPELSNPGVATDLSEYRSTACRLLGVQRAYSEDIDADNVADPIWEYLRLHPYVEQLRINLFGTGDGRLIADVLRRIEELRVATNRSAPPPLRYSVQMFASGPSLVAAGEAVEDLLDPDRQVGQDDEFTLASTNPLFPKLVFARNSMTAFLERPHDYPAHISILADQFGLQCRVSGVATFPRGVFLNGLVVEPAVVETPDESGATWVKGVKPIAGPNPSPAEQLVCRALAATQAAHAGVATGRPQPAGVAPVVALRVAIGTQSLLAAVHEVSDWVLTVDRNLGVEYYDRRESTESGYLLDFSPEYLQPDRRKLFLTTRRPAEVEAIVRPALDGFGLPSADPVPGMVVDTLRSLSGRLALRLLAAPSTQTAEVIGLLLARWLLDLIGVLKDHIVIPLDAHRNWFSTDTLPAGGSGRRADLLLVGFRPGERVIRLNIVEVKFREDLSAPARESLYRDMAEQANNTAERLREMFDPSRFSEPRADFGLGAKELSTLFRFYTDRGARYGLIDGETAGEFTVFLADLDSGYRLDVQTTGVLFLRQSSGMHKDEEEPGFVVHRFGHDVARQLVTQKCLLGDAEPDASHPDSIQERSGANHATGFDARLFDSFASSVTGEPDRSRRSSKHTTPVKLEPPSRTPTEVTATSVEAARPSHEMPPLVPVADVVSPATAVVPDPSREAPRSAQSSVALQVSDGLTLDVLLGASTPTSQFGLIGKAGTSRVGIDLTGCNTISLFGVQGFGKSYTLGVIAEMAVKAVGGVNRLPAPLATVLFHYHKSDSYAPEYLSAVAPNNKRSEVERLRDEYGASPVGLDDVVLLTPQARVADRQREFPSVVVRPIKFRSGELDVEGWKFLLGAYGNDSLYVRNMVAIMRRHRGQLTLERLDAELRDADLSAATRRLVDDRLNLARPYIDDAASLADVLRPGRTVVVDLRDQWIEKDEALGLFVVMLRIFAAATFAGKSFNKLVVFDEAHKYISDSDLVGQVVETIREMRHQATSVIIASQDPLSVPRAVIELTSVLLLHRMTSPQWLKHLKSAISALDVLTDAQVAGLAPGEALVWSQRSTEARFTQRPQKLAVRPRFTQHGGGTKTAVEGESVR